MNNSHKITVDRGCLAVICTDVNCSFKKTCSTHTTAGDFRSEDGFTPELHLVDGDVYCDTYNQKIHDDDKYGFYPTNYRSLNFGMITWKQLESTTPWLKPKGFPSSPKR
jgi:hypothetical protein